MTDYSGPHREQVKRFVRVAVLLPADRLAEMRRRTTGGDLYRHSAVVATLIQASKDAKRNSEELRAYVMDEAHARAGAPGLAPDDVADALIRTAQALMQRELLENHAIAERAAAFVALTAPFADVLSEGTQ
jgi:hypothetical protein